MTAETEDKVANEPQSQKKSSESSGKAVGKRKERQYMRIAEVIRATPDLKSSQVAKLAGVTAKYPDGVVRTTAAWKNRKQLRQAPRTKRGYRIGQDVSDGFCDTGTRGSVEAIVSALKPEHHTINEMIKKYQLGKRKEYPTSKEIAERLSTEDEPVSEQQAAELLRETKAFFDYDD